jgi:hypothetical protein
MTGMIPHQRRDGPRMYDEMPFELIAMNRPEGIARRIIPGEGRRPAGASHFPLWLVTGRAGGSRHRLDRVRVC